MPTIIVLSADDSDTFDWLSDGWYQEHQRHTKKAQDLFTLANDCIQASDNVVDAINRLESAGFEIRGMP